MPEYIFPLRQGVGAPSVPCVKEGETVRRGQRIADIPEGKLGSAIHTSVSGIVRAVTDEAVRIEAAAEQTKDYVPLENADPLSMIRASGLVGLGGAGFPVWAKLGKPFAPEKKGCVIINAAECEPILSHNIDSVEKRPEDVLRGLAIEMDVMHAARGFIAIKKKHTAAVAALQKALAAYTGEKPVNIHLLPDMYPMGEERAIVREVLGELLPPDAIPLAAGAVVSNVETAVRIHEAVDLGKPMIDKDLTVAGKLKTHPGETIVMHDVPVGISACGASEERMKELAASYGSEVVDIEYCKQAMPVRNTRKCLNPGKCPGQVAKVLAIRKAGAGAILIGNCSDCTNTVMSCAPQLGLPVYHSTDLALRAVNHKLIRKIHIAPES